MKRIIVIGILASQSWLAAAATGAQTYVQKFSDDALISEVTIQEVPEQGVFAQPMLDNNCSATPLLNPLDSIGWDQIVSVGQQIWKVISDNRPVITVQQPVAHALPRGLKCWADLDSWKAPTTKRYSIEYKNGLRMTPVKFDFRLHFTPGGGRSGKGKYLSNVTVMPAQLDVKWGYTFNANVEVAQAVNMGTADNPLAGLELNLHWNVKTVLKESENSMHMFVRGDGLFNVAN